MNKILELELRQSEARQELADLLESDADNEKIGALNSEMRSLDRQIMGHKLSNPEPESRVVEGTPEGREIRQLVNKASLGKMMAGIADDGQGNGAERELRQARNLPDNYIPWDLLEKRAAVGRERRRRGEHCAMDSENLPKFGGCVLRSGHSDCGRRRGFGAGDNHWGHNRLRCAWGRSS